MNIINHPTKTIPINIVNVDLEDGVLSTFLSLIFQNRYGIPGVTLSSSDIPSHFGSISGSHRNILSISLGFSNEGSNVVRIGIPDSISNYEKKIRIAKNLLSIDTGVFKVINSDVPNCFRGSDTINSVSRFRIIVPSEGTLPDPF